MNGFPLSRWCAVAAAAVALTTGLAGPASGHSPATAAGKNGRVALPSPVPGWVKGDQRNGPAGSATTMSIRVYLASRAPAAEARFAIAAATPGNRGYGRYLTPSQFRARFGPTPAEATAVAAWARSAGLTVTGSTAHYVAVTGPAPRIGAALDTSIDVIGTRYAAFGYAPVTGMSVPASIGRDVATVTGLDNQDAFLQGPPRPGAAPAPAPAPQATKTTSPCSAWWGQHVSAIPRAEGRSTAPDAVCGYTPQQLRAAYGIRPDSGRGATIAVVLDGSLPTMRADANRFFAAHHLPGFAPGQFTVNTGPGFAATCGTSSDLPEEPLDVETAHILAPAARIVYVAASCTGANNQQGLLDAETRVVDRHLADVSTESYSIAESAFSPAVAIAWTQIFEQGAAEGIGFNFDSGDGGNLIGSGAGGGTAVTFPASDPWATAVGGTTLEIGREGKIVGELGWGDTGSEEKSVGTGYLQVPPGTFQEGTTGGRSDLFAQPGYQRGVVPPSLATEGGTAPAGREVPDISADASPFTGWLIGFTTPGGGYGQQIEGGTSGASPIMTALEADAKQYAGYAIGFANPLLYDLRRSAGIRDILPSRHPALVLGPNCYNDPAAPGPACVITLGLDSGLTETRGYDDATGLGAATRYLPFAMANWRTQLHHAGN